VAGQYGTVTRPVESGVTCTQESTRVTVRGLEATVAAVLDATVRVDAAAGGGGPATAAATNADAISTAGTRVR